MKRQWDKVNNAIKKIIQTLWFKFFVLTLVIFFIILFFVRTLSRFNSTDPLPPLKSITQESTKEFAAFTVHVNTGLFIRNFSYFNMIKNEFIADMIVWFEFNSDEITLNTVSRFSFENGEILKKSLPDVKIVNKKVFVKYNVVVKLKSALEYYKFPLEDHRLSIVLTNNFVTPHEVMFDVLSTDFVIAPKIFVSNWIIKDLSTNFGFDENVLNQIDKTRKILYPKAVFSIAFVKAGLRKTFIIFVPIFLVFFFSLFSFFLSIQNIVGRTTLAVSAVSALLGYRFVIEGMMPKVGYFTTTDYVYIILLGFAFIIFIFQIVVTRIFNARINVTEKPIPVQIDLLVVARDVMFIIISALTTALIGLVVLL